MPCSIHKSAPRLSSPTHRNGNGNGAEECEWECEWAPKYPEAFAFVSVCVCVCVFATVIYDIVVPVLGVEPGSF